MKILYIADHRGIDNDDEGSITYSLRSLGHDVVCSQEEPRKFDSDGFDIMLFHHWQDYLYIESIPIPKVFWTFDLISYPDLDLADRNKHRIEWVRKIMSIADLGFMTDGDWVLQDSTQKLFNLSQGADERVVKMSKGSQTIPLFFAGSLAKVGKERLECLKKLRERYMNKLVILKRSQYVYREQLANRIAQCQIVIAPWGPVTDHYWSNRVYVMLGFGAFLLHPFSESLANHYTDGEEIVFYHGLDDLYSKIDYYLPRAEERDRIRKAGYRRTLLEHTYTHRCQRLVQIVNEQLL